MRTMSTTAMMEANGGKYRYECVRCGKRFRTWVGALGHVISYGKAHNNFYRY